MLIDLEEPFKSLWSKGYIVVNPENRRNVILFNTQTDRTTISYARYLMCVKLGYILSSEFEVDHMDDDKTNDVIGNLQILTKAQNRLKEENRYAMYEQVHYGYICAYCEIPFLLTSSQRSSRLCQGSELAFCCRECGIGYNVQNGSGGLFKSIDQLLIDQIKLLKSQNYSSYYIARELGISGNTVTKYW